MEVGGGGHDYNCTYTQIQSYIERAHDYNHIYIQIESWIESGRGGGGARLQLNIHTDTILNGGWHMTTYLDTDTVPHSDLRRGHKFIDKYTKLHAMNS